MQVPEGERGWRVEAIWVQPKAIRFFGPMPPGPAPGPSAAHHLEGPSGELFDRWVGISRAFHERVEALDSDLALLQAKGNRIPTAEIWALGRSTATIRAQIGRAVVVVEEAAGPISVRFPGLRDAVPSLQAELERARSVAADVQQSISDLILLQNAEQANRIAESANRLSQTSNRIAELANISNIRMLGLTYIALVLGLVSAVVLIPNTAATILGMPSAAWVPGPWVDVVLILLAVVPFLLIFTRPWVLRVLRSFEEAEIPASEGIHDLPEHVEGAPSDPGGPRPGPKRSA